MQTSGNMLFREWKAEIQCCQEQQPCIRVTFSSMQGMEMVYPGEVTEQLQELCRSMEVCHKEWCSFISEKRSHFHSLNHYTSEQMVYLCQWILNVCQKQATAPQQLWHLLSPIKPQCTLTDVRKAFAKVTDVSSLEDYEVDYDDEDFEPSMDLRSNGPSEHEDDEENLMVFSSEEEENSMDSDDDEVAVDLSCSSQGVAMDEGAEDSIEDLWRQFKDDMPRYLNQHLDISTLARFLSYLADTNQQHVIRKLPPALQEGKPNLVLCPTTEVLTSTLSFYMESPEQLLPSTDEVLVCREETTEEEVEIFLRRALGRGSQGSEQKIYTLVNPGLLGYDVSVALGELFELLERSTGPHYRLVIVSPVLHQHRYVPSFFSNHKVQAGVDITVDTARKYLHQHFAVPFLDSPVSLMYPGRLSAWVVSSARPAVGKDELVWSMSRADMP